MKTNYLRKIKAGHYTWGKYELEHKKNLGTWFIIKNNIIIGSRAYLKDAIEWCKKNGS